MCVVNVLFFVVISFSFTVSLSSQLKDLQVLSLKSTGVFTILTWIRFSKYCIRLIYLIKKKLFCNSKILKQQINIEYDILSSDISVSHASLKKLYALFSFYI